jgi:hypothetical protein
MHLKDASPNLVNLLVSGKILVLDKTFYEQGVKSGSKIIFTLKQKI